MLPPPPPFTPGKQSTYYVVFSDSVNPGCEREFSFSWPRLTSPRSRSRSSTKPAPLPPPNHRTQPEHNPGPGLKPVRYSQVLVSRPERQRLPVHLISWRSWTRRRKEKCPRRGGVYFREGFKLSSLVRRVVASSWQTASVPAEKAWSSNTSGGSGPKTQSESHSYGFSKRAAQYHDVTGWASERGREGGGGGYTVLLATLIPVRSDSCIKNKVGDKLVVVFIVQFTRAVSPVTCCVTCHVLGSFLLEDYLLDPSTNHDSSPRFVTSSNN